MCTAQRPPELLPLLFRGTGGGEHALSEGKDDFFRLPGSRRRSHNSRPGIVEVFLFVEEDIGIHLFNPSKCFRVRQDFGLSPPEGLNHRSMKSSVLFEKWFRGRLCVK